MIIIGCGNFSGLIVCDRWWIHTSGCAGQSHPERPFWLQGGRHFFLHARLHGHAGGGEHFAVSTVVLVNVDEIINVYVLKL